MKIEIRQESKKDYPAVFELHKQAFGQEDESRIVERIRESKGFVPGLSLVAMKQGEITGHILFSKIHIETSSSKKETLALAPMAVLPDHQREGIGKKLVNTGLKKAKELGFDSVIVLGHAEYYQKFGFKRASLWEISCPFEVPDEVFMALELQERALTECRGLVSYPKTFSEEA